MDKSKSSDIPLDIINRHSPFESLCNFTSQRAKLLILNRDFQETVRELRRFFNLPEDGLPLDTSEQTESGWREHHIPREPKKPNQDDPVGWDDAITDIMDECQMLAGWRGSVEVYVLHNVFMAPPALQVEKSLDEYGSFEFRIKINDYTTMEDLKFIHNYLRAERTFAGFQRAGQISQPIRHYERYVKMLEYELQEFSDEKIADKVNNEFARASYTKKEIHDSLVFIKKRIAAQMTSA